MKQLRAVITGGTRGIGKAAVELFCKKGFRVVTTYIKSDFAAKELENRTGCTALKCDVSSDSDRKMLFEYVKNNLGGIDVLINNAGISLVCPFDGVSESERDKLYGTDLFGTTEMCRLFIPMMIHQKSGSIVNISSVWGTYGASCEADYSAAKAAVAGLTKALAAELGPSGIRVNCIAPGVIDTDMNACFDYREIQEIIDDIPLERLGKPEEIADAAYFLGVDAEYITGQILGVDGGFR